MAKVITIAGQKGGVGKTTVAIGLAAEWMHRRHRVLLVDGDPQRTATTWAEVALEKGHPVPTVVSMGATMHKSDQLPRLAPSFDVVIVDTPPRLGDVQRAALMVADIVVMPCGPSAHDFWALAEGLELIESARILRPELLVRVLVTRKVASTIIGREARDALIAQGLEAMYTQLGYRTDYQEASAAGLGVSTYRRVSDASGEMQALATELEELFT